MNEIGLAKILEKKEIEINGEKLKYYECIDVAIGFNYTFKNNLKPSFIVLSGKLEGENLSDDSKYYVADFKDLNSLSQKNNNVYNLKKFKKNYCESLGLYVTYDSKQKKFYEITNKLLLNKIKEKNNIYDDYILKGDTDISKMYLKIKETIISQDQQIKKILTSLFKNQEVINSKLDDDIVAKLKENIIVYGSTGTGKTEILKRIANFYNIPIVIEDATSLSETGFVGRDVTDMLKNLYLASGKDLTNAEKGILVVDEFDKLAENKKSDRDHVSRKGVQRSLLKLLDGTNFYFDDMKFNTSKLTVVFLGAFTDIVKDDNYSNVAVSDFVDYGIMRELMGRISKQVVMNPLSREDIKKILVESNFSPLNTYKLLFDEMNIQFSYDEGFLDYVADEAIKLKSGARSLKTIVDNCISEALFKIFSGEYSSVHLIKPDETNNLPYVLVQKDKEKALLKK